MNYQGRCHCGRVRFSFVSEPIQSAARCNCSLCVRRAAVLSPKYIPVKDFTPHENLADLQIYRWNERVLNNYFCRNCGIFTYIGDGEHNEDGYRVNLGCLEGLDIFSLDVKPIDGRSIPLAHQAM